MTRLKVVNSQTKSTYYLNNVDVSCAKLHSYIGETVENNLILHKPSPYLEYSIENLGHIRYKTNVDELNRLYTDDLTPDFSGYFPANHGIIISDMFTNSNEVPTGTLPTYTSHRTDCNNITIAQTTYWCPPVIKRNPGTTHLSGTIQSSRVSSFSYIHKTLLSSVYTNDISFMKFMIYDNTKPFNVSQKQIFQIYPGDAMSSFCLPKPSPDGQYCASGAIGACINYQFKTHTKGPCLQDCSWIARGSTACKNFNSFKHSINKMHSIHGTEVQNYNELIIKSWNYNPHSGMSDRGIIYNASMDIWVEQRPNTDSDWGWNDVSNLSSNKNIPLLAFGVTVPDRTTISGDDISNINYMYIDLSNNLEPSFNKYRSEHDISLMPYHIGLDVSCLTRQDCSNPFFDLKTILPKPTPGPPKCKAKDIRSFRCLIGTYDVSCSCKSVSKKYNCITFYDSSYNRNCIWDISKCTLDNLECKPKS